MRGAELLLVLAVCLVYRVGQSLSAPGRSGKEVLIGEVDIAMRSDVDDEYGATSPQPFDKKCLVDGNVYTHSQMIPSRDQSSHCLCVAGEVYCWWQTFGSPKALSAFAPDSSFSSKLDNSINNNENRNNKNNVNDGGIELSDNEGRPDPGTTEEDYSSEVPPEASEESSGDQLDDNNVESDEQSDIIGDDEDDDEDEGEEEKEEEEDQESNDVRQAVPAAMNATTMSPLTTTSAARPTKAPEPCLFMGRAYQEGEMLPHSTGNCVECRCGTGARIECSPRDCVGLRPQRPGGGDLEFFDGGNTF